MIKKNSYSWNHDALTSADLGKIVPFFYQEVEPNCTVNLDPSYYIKLAPIKLPTQGRFQLKVTYGFVPLRQIWTDFETEFLYPGNFVHPFIQEDHSAHLDKDFLIHYFPCEFADSIATLPAKISALPFRTYFKLYRDHYQRNDVLKTNKTIPYATGSGQDTGTQLTLMRDYYPKDSDRYANLQLAQQVGSPALTLSSTLTLQNLRQLIADSRIAERIASTAQDALSAIQALFGMPSPINTNSTLIAQVIRDLDLSEIVSQSSTDLLPLGATTSIGALTTESKPNENIRFTAPEYGCIMGMVSLVPYPYDIHGLRYPFESTNTREHFYHPELAQLGLVPVKRKELFFANTVEDAEVIGYEPIYNTLRKPQNWVAGDYRDTQADYVLHRNAFMHDTNSVQQPYANEYDYLFGDTDEPQVRYTIRFRGEMLRPIPRVISSESLALTESIISDDSRF